MKKSQFRASLLAASALSISIASQLHAAAYVSTVGGGVWEDPGSWTAASGFPDTFGADSAIITGAAAVVYDDGDGNPLNGGGVSTPATPFTIALALNPGGLSVANGNSITINGGSSLTQTTLLNEIRIGEGAGAASGVGTLNIDGGGLFFSGSSLGVAVGGDIDSNLGNGTGHGIVNLNDGFFGMEVGGGPSTAALGVGIEGATGVFNVGDGGGALATAILDLKTSNNNMGVGVTNQLPGSVLAGNGTVTVKADGLLTYGAGNILVGDTAGGVGLLQVNGGLMGEGAVARGPVTVGSNGGKGDFNVTAGVVNTGSKFTLGTGLGSVGTSVVSGAATSVIFGNNVYDADNDPLTKDKTGATRVGIDGGTGMLTVSGGASWETGADDAGAPVGENTHGLFIGSGATGSTGTVSVDGGTMTQHGWAEIGGGGGNTGTLNVKNGGVYNHLESSRDMQIGYNGGHGIVNVESGGQLNVNWWINIARGAASHGEVTIDGPNSKITMASGILNVGEQGTGTLDIKNGGTFRWNNAGNEDATVGRDGGSVGTLTIATGGVIDAVSNLGATDVGQRHGIRLVVGDGANSRGTVTIEDGTVGLREFSVGNNGGATVTQNGGVVTIGQWLKIGQGDGADDPANPVSYTLNNGVINTPELMVGEGRKGAMTINGGTVNIQNGSFAVGRWGPGWNGGAGHHGEGILTHTGGVINDNNVSGDSDMTLGVTAGAIGTYSISGTAELQGLNNGGNPVDQRHGVRLIVGNDANSRGTMNISDSATVNVRELSVGNNGGATVTQNGGTVTVGRWLKIGEGDAADNDANPVSYTLNAGVINTPELMVGEGRKAEMTVNGGTVNIQNGSFAIGRWGPGWNASRHADGTLTQNSGIINANGNLNIGATDGAKGTYNLSGDGAINGINDLIVATAGGTFGSRGTVNLAFTDSASSMVTNAWLYVGGGTNSEGNINVNNGEFRVNGQSRIGYNNGGGGTGTVSVTGAGSKFTGNDETFVGFGAGSRGTINNDGGTVNINHWLNVGRDGGTGTVTQTGGTFNVRDEARIGIKYGNSAPGTGTLTISGGAFTSGRETIIGGGRGSSGTLNLSQPDPFVSAVLTVGGEWQVGNNGGTGVAHITGGTVIAKSYVAIGRSQPFELVDIATANLVIAGGPNQVSSFAGIYSTSNTQDNGNAGGPFVLGVQVQGLPGGDNDDFAFVGLGNFTVNTTGSYVFGNNTDDGSRLRLSINGGLFSDIITDNVLSGPHTVSSAAQILNAGDMISLEWMWYERGGGAEGETFYNRDGGSNALWEDNTQGLILAGGQYTGTTYKGGGATQGSNGTVFLSGDGVIRKVAENGGTFDIGSWNGGSNVSNTTGRLEQTGGTVDNTVSDTHIGRDTGVVGIWNISNGTATLARLNVGNSGIGTLTMTGGSITALDRVTVGANGGSTGIANLNGGVLSTNFIEAGGGAATLNLGATRIKALGNQADFIRGFTNSGGHSAINLVGAGPTFDTNSFDARIQQTNVFADSDGLLDGLAGTVVTKDGAGTLTVESPIDTNGTVSAHVIAGTLDFEASQTLDGLFIDNGATVTLSALSTPPAPPEALAPVAAMFDGGAFGAALAAESNLSGAPVQGVPEPGTIGMLLAAALGMLGRRSPRRDR